MAAATVETEQAQLKRQLASVQAPSPVPWWEKIAGTFADSEEYDEAMRLGREYRESLPPQPPGERIAPRC